MEYYSTLKNEILSFATTQMNLEDIMPSKVSRYRKTKTMYSHLHVESEKVEAE